MQYNAQKHKCIIGMPVHNDLKPFMKAVESICHSTKTPFRFIIIESESTDGAKEYCKVLPFLYDWVDFEVIHTKKEGPLAAYNLLFKKAKEYQMDLYLTQTDVIHFRLYKRDWLYEMTELAKNEEIGLIGPIGAWGKADSIAPNIDWIGGWACYVPIRTINALGGYDTQYEIGDLVDVDYAYAVQATGLKLAQINFWIQHHWMTAHLNEKRNDLEEIKARNRERFRRKFLLSG